ncbi:MAG: OmpA family protein [Chlorobi bacterium]|nr:OmpA family protein [Chlorobiota bacterium]
MVKKAILFFLALGLFTGNLVLSQEMIRVNRDEFKSQEQGFDQAWKNLREGDRLFAQGLGYYVAAREKYLTANVYNPYNPRLNYKIGVCYLFTDHKQKALSFLLTAFEGDPEVSRDIHYFLGWAYQENYKFEQAQKEYELFLNQADKKMLKKYQAAAQNHIRECKNGIELMKDTVKVEIADLGPAINSAFDDYKVVLSSTDRHMFYTSRRPDSPKALPNISDYKFNESIYQSFADENGWGNGQMMKKPLNSKYNDAALDFSPDDLDLYIYRGDKKNGNILVSENIQGNWSRPVNAASKINSRGKETAIYIARDSSMILFVSNNKKITTGGKDIFVMFPDEKGGWSKPVSVDSVINTPFDEESPYLTDDGKVLYFSSKGHNTMGGYDIFKSVRQDDGSWGEPVNLGYPVNTPDDDLFFVFSNDSLLAYVSGIREKSEGLMDIYSVKYIPPPVDTTEVVADTVPLVDTVHVVVMDTVKVEQVVQVMDTIPVAAPVEEPKIKPLVVKGVVMDEDNTAPIMARIDIIDLNQNNIVGTTISDRANGAYSILMKERKSYGAEINAPGYMFLLDIIPAPSSPDDTLIIRNFLMKKMKVGAAVVLNNIFFEFGKATLTPSSYPELDRVIKFMDSNPSIRVEIDGHTDNVGSAEYNLKLSEQRAKSVARYLIEHGVDASRILYKGFGFSQPVDTNETEEGRARNRRVEFKIIGM